MHFSSRTLAYCLSHLLPFVFQFYFCSLLCFLFVLSFSCPFTLPLQNLFTRHLANEKGGFYLNNSNIRVGLFFIFCFFLFLLIMGLNISNRIVPIEVSLTPHCTLLSFKIPLLWRSRHCKLNEFRTVIGHLLCLCFTLPFANTFTFTFPFIIFISMK